MRGKVGEGREEGRTNTNVDYWKIAEYYCYSQKFIVTSFLVLLLEGRNKNEFTTTHPILLLRFTSWRLNTHTLSGCVSEWVKWGLIPALTEKSSWGRGSTTWAFCKALSGCAHMKILVVNQSLWSPWKQKQEIARWRRSEWLSVYTCMGESVGCGDWT